jgi:hypothetical protein
MNTENSNSDRGLWLAWFLASLIGYALGMVLGASMAYSVFDSDTFDGTMGVTLGIVMGTIGGFAQWVVLRDRFAGAGWWILASALGFAMVFSMGGTVRPNENPAMIGIRMAIAFGLVAGVPQWIILRQKVTRAGWWVLANMLGLLVAEMGFPLSIAISAATGNDNLSMLVVALVFAAGYGAVTASALVLLLSQSGSSKVESLATPHG